MIRLTRYDKSEFLLNPELIKSIEETPDTIITLSTGEKIKVINSSFDVVQRIRSNRI